MLELCSIRNSIAICNTINNEDTSVQRKYYFISSVIYIERMYIIYFIVLLYKLVKL